MTYSGEECYCEKKHLHNYKKKTNKIKNETILFVDKLLTNRCTEKKRSILNTVNIAKLEHSKT